MKKTLILGAGGHAKVVADVMQLTGVSVDGFVTPNLDVGNYFLNATIINDDDVLRWKPDEVNLLNGIGSLPYSMLRWRIAEKMRRHGYRFGQVVHPSSIVARDVTVNEGGQVMAGAVIQPGSSIGRDTIINTGTSIDHDCVIGDQCHIAPGVSCSGGVKIGDDCHIGTGAVITQGVTIGNGCVVAAGSVVYRDLSDHSRLIQHRQARIDTNHA